MLEKLCESFGPVVGFKVAGKVAVEDYRRLDSEVQDLVDRYDKVCMLIDLQEFAGEEVRAWLPDLKFGHRFYDKIEKMAIVGDKRWQKWLTALADPFYAKDSRIFHPGEVDQAWDWLREDGQATDDGKDMEKGQK